MNPLLRDKSGFVTVHSGTTVENYKTCAHVRGNSVIFDKSREPLYYDKSLFFVPAFRGGARYAFERAEELDHTPCIIAGRVKKSLMYEYRLPENATFIVEGLWIPKKEVDWKTLHPYATDSLEDYFDEMNPRDLLSS